MEQLLEKPVFSWQCLQASLHVDCCDRNQGGTCKEMRKIMKGRTYGSGENLKPLPTSNVFRLLFMVNAVVGIMLVPARS
jgi:hypothetical protein